MSRETPDMDHEPSSHNLRSPQYYSKPTQLVSTAEPKRIKYQNSMSYKGSPTSNTMLSSSKQMGAGATR